MRQVVAITGSTGGILSKVCIQLVLDNYDLVLINRNYAKTIEQRTELLKLNNVDIDIIVADMSKMKDVKKVSNELKYRKIDYMILSSAIYNVPIEKLDTGYNNVFQVNFLSPYYLINKLIDKDMKFIIVGSVAYKYQSIDINDIDLSNSKKQTHIYGNSKRYLMFSLMDNNKVTIAHPGITLTNLTNHYPRWINWLVKIGIKLLFPSNKKASRNILYALNHETMNNEWIGPSIFNIWGKPKIKKIQIDEKEKQKIKENAYNIYKKLEEKK